MKTAEDKEHVIEFMHASGQVEIGEIKKLFIEYVQSLDTDLAFQDFETEIETLPGKYTSPGGALIIALIDCKAAGCIALRKISDDICEMKRLYVKDSYRGFGIGIGLVNMIIEEAIMLNYRFIRLDTLPTMKKAQDLYKSLGFYEIEPYVYNPISGTKYLELELNASYNVNI
jgi:ribosomal protein S18 acetylase RimI-like enzyme